MAKAQAPTSGDSDAGLESQGVGWDEESLPLQMFILVFILLTSLKTIRKNLPDYREIKTFERTSTIPVSLLSCDFIGLYAQI